MNTVAGTTLLIGAVRPVADYMAIPCSSSGSRYSPAQDPTHLPFIGLATNSQPSSDISIIAIKMTIVAFQSEELRSKQ